MELYHILLTTLILFVGKLSVVTGHGRLMDPPARNVMWRYGFGTFVEYKDNFVYCGNRTAFHGEGKETSGKCGVCGDQLWGKKDHKVGAGAAQRTIGRRYSVGQEIPVEVELTANHWGRFEMHLCPNKDPSREITQSCFDKHPLYVVGTQDEVRFMIPQDFRKWGVFQYKVRLPPNVTCSNCVLQWTYYGGRAWNKCANGTEAIGCGEVDIFRNCADVAIDPSERNTTKLEGEGVSIPLASMATPTTASPSQEPHPQEMPSSSEATGSFLPSSGSVDLEELPKLPTPVRAQVCISTPMFRKLFEADDWCMQKCMSYPAICPPNMCTCPDTCDAVGSMAGKAGADTWCQGWCIIYPYKCHEEERCKCYKADDENSLLTKPFNFEDTNIFNYD